MKSQMKSRLCTVSFKYVGMKSKCSTNQSIEYILNFLKKHCPPNSLKYSTLIFLSMQV